MSLTNENYFSPEANLEYMSCSQFKNFQRCPASALAEIRGEYTREKTTSLLVGSYVDAWAEGTLDKFKQENPEIFKRDGTLKAEYIQAESIIERIKRDQYFMEHLSGEKQVIMTGEIEGVPVKIKVDCLLPDRIVDLKIVKDFEPLYHPEKGRLAWFEYWGYDLQGAIYQEIVWQNTGESLPFYIAAATKEKVTDIDIIEIDQMTMDCQLDMVKAEIARFDAMKNGIIEPDRCGKCDFCKMTKVLTAPTKAEEYYFM